MAAPASNSRANTPTSSFPNVEMDHGWLTVVCCAVCLFTLQLDQAAFLKSRAFCGSAICFEPILLRTNNFCHFFIAIAMVLGEFVGMSVYFLKRQRRSSSSMPCLMLSRTGQTIACLRVRFVCIRPQAFRFAEIQCNAPEIV